MDPVLINFLNRIQLFLVQRFFNRAPVMRYRFAAPSFRVRILQVVLFDFFLHKTAANKKPSSSREVNPGRFSSYFPFNICAVPRHCSLLSSTRLRSAIVLSGPLIGNHSHTANCQSPVARIGFHPIQLSSADSARVRSCYPDYPEIRQIETIDGTYGT